MDAYLADANSPGQYHKLLRQVERFRDIGKIMALVEVEYLDDAADMMRLLFASIRAGIPHGDIRAIRRMFLKDRERYERLQRQVSSNEEEWENSGVHTIPDPDLSVNTEEDEEYDDSDDSGTTDVCVPGSINYPATQVSSRIKNAIDGFNVASLDVLSMLEQIDSRIETLRGAEEQLKQALTGKQSGEVRERLSRIIAWANEAKKY